MAEKKQSKNSVKNKSKNQINKKMILGDVVKAFPKAAEIMMEYGLHCVGCHVASWESIEQGASGHDLDNDEIDKMVDDINRTINEKSKTYEHSQNKKVKRHLTHPNSM